MTRNRRCLGSQLGIYIFETNLLASSSSEKGFRTPSRFFILIIQNIQSLFTQDPSSLPETPPLPPSPPPLLHLPFSFSPSPPPLLHLPFSTFPFPLPSSLHSPSPSPFPPLTSRHPPPSQQPPSKPHQLQNPFPGDADKNGAAGIEGLGGKREKMNREKGKREKRRGRREEGEGK